MVFWWLGRRKSEVDSVQEDSSPGDAPETPAAVFAARAFKTAIFGTPAPPNDPDHKPEENSSRPIINGTSYQPQNLNFAKPSGILVTPGASLSRRKTVTFGSDVQQDVERIRKPKSADDLSKECLGNVQSISRTNSIFYDQPTRITPLTREMERVREGKLGNRNDKKSDSVAGKTVNSSVDNEKYSERQQDSMSYPKDEKDFRDLKYYSESNKCEEDTTVNLNEPRSNSGKYWKSEFEVYTQDAQSELKKLFSQREAAKSFALTQQAKATKLAEMLDEEQQKVHVMQERISTLMTKFGSTEHKSDEDPTLNSTREPVLSSDMKIKISTLQKNQEKMSALELENNRLRHLLLEKNEIITKLNIENREITQRILDLKSRLKEGGWKYSSLQINQTASVLNRSPLDNNGFEDQKTGHKTDIEHKMDLCNKPSTHSPMNSRLSRHSNVGIKKPATPEKAIEHKSAKNDHQNETRSSPLSIQQYARDRSIPNKNLQTSPPERIIPSTHPRTCQFESTEAIDNAGIDSIPSSCYGPVKHSPLVNTNNDDIKDPISTRFYTSNCDIPSTQQTNPKLNFKPEVPNDFNYQSSSKRNTIGVQASPLKISRRNEDRLDSRTPAMDKAYRKNTRAKIPPERFAAATKRLAEKKLAAAANSGRKRNIEA